MPNYQINAANATMDPVMQLWQDLIVGYDHQQKPIFSKFKEVILEFDSATVSDMNGWSKFVNGNSLTSIKMLAIDSAASYVVYTDCVLAFDRRPQLLEGIAGPFSIRVSGVIPT